jgi:hypothetical protein
MKADAKVKRLFETDITGWLILPADLQSGAIL